MISEGSEFRCHQSLLHDVHGLGGETCQEDGMEIRR